MLDSRQTSYAEPLILLETPQLERPRWATSATGSVLAHLLAVAVWIFVPIPGPNDPGQSGAVSELRLTPLVMPPEFIKPRAPAQPAADVTLDKLLAPPTPKPQPSRASVPAPRSIRIPVPGPAPAEQPKPIEAPKIDIKNPEPFEVAKNLPPGIGAPTAPPQIQPAERPPASNPPKLAFENVGGATGTRTGGSATAARIPVPPKNTVEEATRAVVRARGAGGLTVGDTGAEGIGGVAPSLGQPTGSPKNLSSLEMMSDPMGVDFKPYLIRILATVKRNWQAVMPESVRLGRRGRVQIQFAISRDGSVPKLVIASSAGADALDRAAVAGISASNPFPPLPPEFQGQQVRLQFTFLYNMPTQ